jgi:UDP-glucose 4-epimerase
VVPKFLEQAQNDLPITIYGDGLQTRSFCYVEDTITACIEAFRSGNYVNDVLNVGNDNEMTILELAKRIIKVTNSKSEIIHLPALKEGDMTRRCPDITKMKKILNRDLITLEEGLQQIIAYKNLVPKD